MTAEPHIVHPVPEPTGEVRFCPVCDSDLQDREIPMEQREAYGGKTHFSRLIGVEVQGHYDGVAEWLCSDCGANWPRAGIGLTPRMREAVDLDLARANARPPDRLTGLAEDRQ